MSAKDIVLRPIGRAEADAVVKRIHYSGTVVQNSQTSIGVFYNGSLEGAMQFGPPMSKNKLVGLVEGTPWNGFVELNRLAFSAALPRNSESRAISVAMRLLRKHAPHVGWVVTFADGAQCGDGTIYRASGFVLTGYSTGNMVRLPEHLRHLNGGRAVAHQMACVQRVALRKYIRARSHGKALGIPGVARLLGGEVVKGYQFRYLYFLDPACRERLTVPVLPFDTIDKLNARMYRGRSIGGDAPASCGDEGGSNPTRPLQRPPSGGATRGV